MPDQEPREPTGHEEQHSGHNESEHDVSGKETPSPSGPTTPEPPVRRETGATALSPTPDMSGNQLPAPPGPPAGHSRGGDRTTYEILNRRVLIGLLVVLTLALLPMLRLFVAPIVVSLTFAALFYPFYAWTNKVMKRRRGLSSFVCCLALLLGLLIPTYVVVHLVALQAVDLYNTAGPMVRDVLRKGSEGPLGQITRHQVIGWLRLQEIDWQAVLQEIAKAAGKFGSFVVNKTSVGLLAAAGNLFVVFFMLFYLFRDGERFLERFRYLSPLRNEYEEMLLKRFLLISRASIRGTLLIGLIQGVIGALVFLAVGINTWLVWGFVMVALSIIPFTGAWFVMVPAGIIQIAIGHVWQGILVIVFCVAVVSTIDNVLRPRLVGTQAKLHDLLIFFATLGGISVFGVMGFIVGPVTAALFVTVLDIYGLEFQSQLMAAQNDS